MKKFFYEDLIDNIKDYINTSKDLKLISSAFSSTSKLHGGKGVRVAKIILVTRLLSLLSYLK